MVLQDSRNSHYSLGNEQHKVRTVPKYFFPLLFVFFFLMMLAKKFFLFIFAKFAFYQIFIFLRIFDLVFLLIFFSFFGIILLYSGFWNFIHFIIFFFFQVKYMSVARESMNKVYQTDDGTCVHSTQFLQFFLSQILLSSHDICF